MADRDDLAASSGTREILAARSTVRRLWVSTPAPSVPRCCRRHGRRSASPVPARGDGPAPGTLTWRLADLAAMSVTVSDARARIPPWAIRKYEGPSGPER